MTVRKIAVMVAGVQLCSALLGKVLMSILFLLALSAGAEARSFYKDESLYHAAKFQHVEEWSSWKLKHGKNYSSTLEELERHLIWLSNKKYIDHHNINAHIFGFELAMNHLGDMVKA